MVDFERKEQYGSTKDYNYAKKERQEHAVCETGYHL